MALQDSQPISIEISGPYFRTTASNATDLMPQYEKAGARHLVGFDSIRRMARIFLMKARPQSFLGIRKPAS